ncbi:hypothetical protein EV368DRAFT_85522 [Lentinula lateritia]|nr:hypothetical protein EV368DRAFT_85522 [Lentinula lateritia]
MSEDGSDDGSDDDLGDEQGDSNDDDDDDLDVGGDDWQWDDGNTYDLHLILSTS